MSCANGSAISDIIKSIRIFFFYLHIYLLSQHFIDHTTVYSILFHYIERSDTYLHEACNASNKHIEAQESDDQDADKLKF